MEDCLCPLSRQGTETKVWTETRTGKPFRLLILRAYRRKFSRSKNKAVIWGGFNLDGAIFDLCEIKRTKKEGRQKCTRKGFSWQWWSAFVPY